MVTCLAGWAPCLFRQRRILQVTHRSEETEPETVYHGIQSDHHTCKMFPADFCRADKFLDIQFTLILFKAGYLTISTKTRGMKSSSTPVINLFLRPQIIKVDLLQPF